MNKKIENNKELSKNHKILAKNTLFSFLASYGNYISSIITSFIIARIISQENWGFLILATSIVNIFTFILLFFPPSLGLAMNYYIPQYQALNQYSKLKSIVQKSLIIRLLFVIPVYFLSLLIYYLFFDFFKLGLKNYTYLFYILSPLIIINSFDTNLKDISRALNMFQFVFILFLIKYIVNIGGLIYVFLFINTNEVNIIALITLFSSLIPFIINILSIFLILKYKIKKTDENSLTFHETFKNIYKYGSILSIKNFLDNFYREFKVQSVGFLIAPEFATGFNIAQHYQDVSIEAVRSLGKPLTISFSSLYSVKQFKQIEKIYTVFFSYSLFLILLLTGILYFLVDIFLFLIYGESYLSFSLVVKLMLMIAIFTLPSTIFFSLLRASDKIKYAIPLSFLYISIRIPLFLIGLIYFGIEGGVLLLIIAEIFISIGFVLLTKKTFKIQLSFKKHGLPYILFFFSLGMTIIMEFFFLSEFNRIILTFLNLQIFRYFNLISLAVFFLSFLFLVFLFKVFNSTDIENIKALFNKDNFIHKSIRRGLRILNKFVRE